MTSVGALSSTFTPSASCLTAQWKYNNTWIFTDKVASTKFTGSYLSLGPPSTSDCLPSMFKPTSVFYSPGVCPSGYTQACSVTSQIGSLIETQATCCPSYYTCNTASVTEDAYWYSTDICTATNTINGPITITSYNGLALATETYATMLSSGGGFNAYGISIRYQSSDFATATSSSSFLSTSTSSSTITSPPSNTSTTTSAPAPSSSSSLSGGAIAGIVIGVLLGIALLTAALFYLLRKGKRHAVQFTPVSASAQPSYGSKQVGEQEYSPGQYPLGQYSDGQDAHEQYPSRQYPMQYQTSGISGSTGSMPADIPRELPAGHLSHELPT